MMRKEGIGLECAGKGRNRDRGVTGNDSKLG